MKIEIQIRPGGKITFLYHKESKNILTDLNGEVEDGIKICSNTLCKGGKLKGIALEIESPTEDYFEKICRQWLLQMRRRLYRKVVAENVLKGDVDIMKCKAGLNQVLIKLVSVGYEID